MNKPQFVDVVAGEDRVAYLNPEGTRLASEKPTFCYLTPWIARSLANGDLVEVKAKQPPVARAAEETPKKQTRNEDG